MKVKILIVIACLMLSGIVQAQDYEGVWHLTKVIQDDDTLKVNFEENYDELTVYPQNSSESSRIDALFEGEAKEIYRIARNYYIMVRFDPEIFDKRYMNNSCYCHFSNSPKEPNLWYQFCEGEITLFQVELKNEKLHLAELPKKISIEEDIEKDIYIYEKGTINVENDR